MKRTLISISMLLAATAASASPWTYRGTLNDGGAPANGRYQLRVTLLNESKTASISAPITLQNVSVVNGAFAAEVDFGIDLSNAPVMSIKTEVQQGSSDFVALGEPTRFDPKAALAGICWDTEGNATIAPLTEYIGTPSNSTLVLRSGGGVAINLPGQIGSGTADLLVGAKSSGDADADLRLQSRTGKGASVYVRDNNGSLVLASTTGTAEYFGGLSSAIRNGGSGVHLFNGRLRSYAVGPAPTDISGGMWMDDERPQASYVGRGDNQSNWTGFFSGDAAWTALSTDDGAFMINRVPPLSSIGADLVVGARPVGGDADADIVLETRGNKRGRVYLSDSTGSFEWTAFNLSAGSSFFSMGNGASLSNGGVWTNASSRELKTGFAAINPLDLLSKVLTLPLSTWTYKGSSEGTHIGPMAEDFKSTFGLAGDGKAIGTVDADGVALAAIQGLNQKLETENASLKAKLNAQDVRLRALEAKLK